VAYVYQVRKVWYVGYTDSAGVARREATKARGKTEAKEIAGELERKAFRARKGLELEVGGDTLFEQRALEWLAHLPKEYRTKDTAETYLRQRILPHLGEKPCRAITRSDVREMLKANETAKTGRDSTGRPIVLRPASAATREKLRAYVHTIFEWLIDDLEVVVARNPAAGKRMRVQVPRTLPRYVPVPELRALVQAIPDHYRLLFVFAVVSGVRKGELLPLTWEDVRLGQRQVLITKSRGWATTKGRRERVVIIPVWLLPAFVAERERGFSQLVFPNAEGKRHRFDVKLSRVMRTAAKAAGLITGYAHVCRRKGCGEREELPTGEQTRCPKCTYRRWVEPIPRMYRFKDLRSTFGTLAAAESGDLRYVQQVLGHQSLSTTESHYVHALDDGLRAKTDALRAFDPLAGAVRNLGGPAVEASRNGATGSQASAEEPQN
jgi:integrase